MDKGAWRPMVHAAAKSLQSCPNLCDPTDGSPPDSPVPGILQARTLEWVAACLFPVSVNLILFCYICLLVYFLDSPY